MSMIPLFLLHILLRYPGTFWKCCNITDLGRLDISSTIRNWDRVRLIPLTEDTDLTTKPKAPLTPISRTDVVNISYCRVLRLTFRPYPKFFDKFEKNLKEAASFNLVPEELRSRRPRIRVI
ncbi:hypothetical protein MFLAVUS_000192 [Mucor flavus]|uniref:Uncharacterized protein n=1 Tax=Mucor flavus TaxID=439312 RepID=A0ABP9YJ01_9FUNG